MLSHGSAQPRWQDLMFVKEMERIEVEGYQEEEPYAQGPRAIHIGNTYLYVEEGVYEPWWHTAEHMGEDDARFLAAKHLQIAGSLRPHLQNLMLAS